MGDVRETSRSISKGDFMGYAHGDTVVHPEHGAGVVEGVVTKDIGQGPTEYLELHIDFRSLKILVPAESLERVGLRSLSSREDAEAILALLEEDSEVPTEWSERNTVTVSRMKSRELDQIAMVVRDLTRHQRRIGKPLNMGEQTALKTCLGLLARELALTLDITESETLALLTERAAGHDVADGSQEPVASP